MDWLLVALVSGLSFAVLVLGWTVIILTARSKRQQGPPAVEQAPQQHLHVSKDDSARVKGTGPIPPMPQIGFRNPRKVFRDAFINGDTQSATAILPELARMLGPDNYEYLICAGALAAVGEQIGLQPLLNAINSNDVADESVFKSVLTSAVQYYVSTDHEREGLSKIKEALEQYVYDACRPKEFRAHIANQLQMLYFGAGRTNDALKAANLAIELDPKESSYYFNLSTIYEKLKEIERAIEAIERCMEMGADALDPDHLLQAWDLYRQIGYEQKMKAVRNRLDALGRQLQHRAT